MSPQADPPKARSAPKRRPSTAASASSKTPAGATASKKTRPKKARRAASKPPELHGAEVVLVNGLDLALALRYAPGTTPAVVAAHKGKAAADVIWVAQERSIPLIELPALGASDLAAFKVGEEIPETWFRPVAHALALLYRTAPAPGLVRFVRPVASRADARASQLGADFAEALNVSPIVVEMGVGLHAAQDDFREPLQQMRQRIAMEMGLLLPAVPMRLNPHLADEAFTIRFHDVPVHDGQIDLPIDSPEKLYVVSNRLKQLIYRNGWELLSYQDVDTHVELIRKSHPALVRALFPQSLTLSALRQVLRNLLREQLSIRDLATILEVLLENLAQTQDPDLLTECVRMADSRSLCHKFQDAEGYLNAIVFNPEVERVVMSALQDSGGVKWLDLGPDDGLRVLRAMDAALKRALALQFQPVLLTSPMPRRFVSRSVEPIFPELPIMSYNEIAPLSEVRSIGAVTF